MLSKELFSQREVNQIFQHIPVKTLRWWGLMGLYGWVNEVVDGRGIHREYGLGNLYQIGIVEALASLNISTLIIKLTMAQSFRSGIRMSPPIELVETGGEVREIPDLQGSPEVNVLDQMDKKLVLTKRLFGTVSSPGKKERPSFGWNSLVVERSELPRLFALNAGPGTKIVIDLASIKATVDMLVSRA
jgi:hypothetical protein